MILSEANLSCVSRLIDFNGIVDLSIKSTSNNYYLCSEEEFMDHVVYLDTKAKELDNLLSGKKTIVVRGATGRKMPYGRVKKGDILYFIENNGDGLVKAKAKVKMVDNSEKLTPEESEKLLQKHQSHTLLNESLLKRFSKRYIVFVGIEEVKKLEPFMIDRSKYGNMDDWLPVENIDTVRC